MIAQIINMHKIRYVKMASLTSRYMKKTGQVYIDLDSIIKVLVNKAVNQYIVAGDEKDITLEFVSSVVNLASHYRQYFANNGKDVDVVIYSTFPYKDIDFNKYYDYNENYKKNFIDKLSSIDGYRVKAVIERAMPIIRTVLTYVDGCYLVTTDKFESSAIPYIHHQHFARKAEGDVFIISKDRYNYQYVNRGFILLRPKGLESYRIDEDNLWETLCTEERVQQIQLDNSFYKFVYTVLGDEFRGFEKVKRVGLATLAKTIERSIKKGQVSKKDNSIFVLETILHPDARETVHKNYKCVDLDRQFSKLSHVVRLDIENQLIDKYDKASIEKLNNDYFLKYPIDIIGLNPTIKDMKYTSRQSVFARYGR